MSLGDVPINKIGLMDSGLRFLVNFEPERDYVAVRKQTGLFATGIKSDDYTYSSKAEAKLNTTYALRVIAYNVDDFRAQFLASDKRADMIAAFRIIRIDANGGATIVWKRLSIDSAPKLVLPKPSKPTSQRK